ncbi:MAG: serine/threonine-protein kinase [Novosphingobium sp.]
MTEDGIERRAMALFERLFDVPENERESWIEEHAEGDGALRDRLKSLLRAERLISLRTGGATEGDAFDDKPPEWIGAYRITGLIGRGGMGSVFRGERDAGDFTHSVAIKLIKPGLLSPALVERFERERQTLATLVHPNIAQLYDGGATGDGVPYIVMELVEGRPLLQWIEETKPDLAGRLDVFMQACAGVGFAHHNLVVHRDLTPSNILVDRSGQVKLIDFGIAKPADPAAPGGQPGVTSLDSLSLTPGYAAPERMMSSHVSTAADIYSLGKVLVLLVVGEERDPEFEAICARATALDPDARYPTVEALVADITAWRGQFPVVAFAGGRSYRWRKFARRNWRGLVVSGGAAALTLGAFAITGWALVRANEYSRADSRRFGEVRSLAHYLVYDFNDRLARTPGNTAARGELVGEAQRYFELLAASPGKPADLQLEIARGLVRLARIQGDPIEPNLGDFARAEQNLDRALELLEPFAGQPGSDPDRAEALIHKAMLALHAGSREGEARERLGEAEKVLVAIPEQARVPSWYRVRRQMRIAQLELADLDDRPEEIDGIAAAMIAERAAWPAAMRKGDLAVLDDALAAHYRALGLAYAEKPGALPLFIEAERGFDRLLRKEPNDPQVLYRSARNAYEGFAEASREAEDAKADRLIAKAADTVSRLLAVEEHDNAIVALAANIEEARAQSLRDQGHFAEAIALEKKVVEGRRLAARRTDGAGEKGDLGFSLMVLGVVARDGGDRALACTSWRESESVLTALQRKGDIIGFHASFIPGLAKKHSACASGGPIDAPMR